MSNGIGWAVKQMQDGARVTRAGWNGKGMWLALQVPDAHSKMGRPYVYIRSVDSQLVPWVCSQSDLLATDWECAAVEALAAIVGARAGGVLPRDVVFDAAILDAYNREREGDAEAKVAAAVAETIAR